MNLKPERWRNGAYLKWVKTLPCVVSGLPADDAHHLIGHGMHGMGTKAPDWAVFPLTRLEHERLHHMGWRQWEERYGSQWHHVAQTLGKAIDAGILRVK